MAGAGKESLAGCYKVLPCPSLLHPAHRPTGPPPVPPSPAPPPMMLLTTWAYPCSPTWPAGHTPAPPPDQLGIPLLPHLTAPAAPS